MASRVVERQIIDFKVMEIAGNGRIREITGDWRMKEMLGNSKVIHRSKISGV